MSLTSKRKSHATLALLASVLVAGCRDDGSLPTYPVAGKVTFADGSPLRGGWIVCESEVKAPAARGTINEDGTFVLGTYESADGAVEGRHRVSITPAMPEGYDPDGERAPSPIDGRFTLLDASGLSFEVDADGTNEVELVVTPPGRR